MLSNRYAVVFVGPPGCGKGTQGDFLCKERGFFTFSTGDIIRKEIAEKSELGCQLKKICDEGRLVPDDVILGMLKKVIDHLDTNKVLFDGFPRTVEQANALNRSLSLDDGWRLRVYYFSVEDAVVMRRVLGRFSCKVCGQGYNERTLKPKVDGVCDVCAGTDFVRRDDDNEKTLLKRLESYKRVTGPLVDFYEKQGVLETLDASLEVEDVWNNVAASVDGFLQD